MDDSSSLLDTMVGNRVLVERVAVEPPLPEEDDEDSVEEAWPDNIRHLSETIGATGALHLVGYNQFGIEVREGVGGLPSFIPWHAVIRIEPLSD